MPKRAGIKLIKDGIKNEFNRIKAMINNNQLIDAENSIDKLALRVELFNKNLYVGKDQGSYDKLLADLKDTYSQKIVANGFIKNVFEVNEAFRKKKEQTRKARGSSHKPTESRAEEEGTEKNTRALSETIPPKETLETEPPKAYELEEIENIQGLTETISIVELNNSLRSVLNTVQNFIEPMLPVLSWFFPTKQAKSTLIQNPVIASTTNLPEMSVELMTGNLGQINRGPISIPLKDALNEPELALFNLINASSETDPLTLENDPSSNVRLSPDETLSIVSMIAAADLTLHPEKASKAFVSTKPVDFFIAGCKYSIERGITSAIIQLNDVNGTQHTYELNLKTLLQQMKSKTLENLTPEHQNVLRSIFYSPQNITNITFLSKALTPEMLEETDSNLVLEQRTLENITAKQSIPQAVTEENGVIVSPAAPPETQNVAASANDFGSSLTGETMNKASKLINNQNAEPKNETIIASKPEAISERELPGVSIKTPQEPASEKNRNSNKNVKTVQPSVSVTPENQIGSSLIEKETISRIKAEESSGSNETIDDTQMTDYIISETTSSMSQSVINASSDDTPMIDTSSEEETQDIQNNISNYNEKKNLDSARLTLLLALLVTTPNLILLYSVLNGLLSTKKIIDDTKGMEAATNLANPINRTRTNIMSNEDKKINPLNVENNSLKALIEKFPSEMESPSNESKTVEMKKIREKMMGYTDKPVPTEQVVVAQENTIENTQETSSAATARPNEQNDPRILQTNAKATADPHAQTLENTQKRSEKTPNSVQNDEEVTTSDQYISNLMEQAQAEIDAGELTQAIQSIEDLQKDIDNFDKIAKQPNKDGEIQRYIFKHLIPRYKTKMDHLKAELAKSEELETTLTSRIERAMNSLTDGIDKLGDTHPNTHQMKELKINLSNVNYALEQKKTVPIKKSSLYEGEALLVKATLASALIGAMAELEQKNTNIDDLRIKTLINKLSEGTNQVLSASSEVARNASVKNLQKLVDDSEKEFKNETGLWYYIQPILNRVAKALVNFSYAYTLITKGTSEDYESSIKNWTKKPEAQIIYDGSKKSIDTLKDEMAKLKQDQENTNPNSSPGPQKK